MITALSAAIAAMVGSGVTYLVQRSQLREARQKDQESTRRELNAAELEYRVKIQEMLVASGDRLMAAQAAHSQKETILERERYIALEEIKRLKFQQEQELADRRRFEEEQDEEIQKRDRIIEAKDRSIEQLKKRVEQLNQTLETLGIPRVDP